MQNSELRPLMKLAGPVILAEVGWMSMGLVDTIMVGPLGPAAIAATGMGSGVFTAIVIFGMGLMLGLDAFVSQAHGAGDERECRRLAASGRVAGVLRGADRDGADVAPVRHARPLGAASRDSSSRRSVHPRHLVQRVAAARLRLVSPLPAGDAPRPADHGRARLSEHHQRGSELDVDLRQPRHARSWRRRIGVGHDVSARVYMAAFLYFAIRLEHRRRGQPSSRGRPRDRPARIRRLIALGFPAASQVALEVGVFAVATALAGRLDPVSSGAHQIALNIASLAFMVPLGLASSAARARRLCVRRGRPSPGGTRWMDGALATGCRDHDRPRAGVLSLARGAAARVQPPIRASSRSASGLLAIAAAFQLFDGTQAVVTGVLRGISETRMPMIVNVIGHWFLGLPVGYALCFRFGWGVAGLWIGLSIGLVFAALVLTVVWWKRTLMLVMQDAKCECKRFTSELLHCAFRLNYKIMLNDSHCHFFSTQFFTTLSRQRGRGDTVAALCQELQWDDPGTPEALADRWVNGARRERRDASGSHRQRARRRSVGGGGSGSTPGSLRRLLHGRSVRGAKRSRVSRMRSRHSACAWPVSSRRCITSRSTIRELTVSSKPSPRSRELRCSSTAACSRSACERKLGLPSRFDLSLGDPLAISRLALAHPRLPFIVPHFGAGMLRETMMAADACPNIHRGHVELEQLDPLRAWMDAEWRVQDGHVSAWTIANALRDGFVVLPPRLAARDLRIAEGRDQRGRDKRERSVADFWW